MTWPLDWRPASQEFWLASLTAVFTNPFTGAQQALERDGQRWVCRMTLRRGLALGPQIDAFLAAIGGPGGEAVLVPDFRTLAARGSLAGAPVLAGGSGRTLILTGFTPGAAGVLLPGDLIQAAPGRGHLVLAAIDAAGDGSATVPVAPRLRAAVTPGPLVTAAVRVRMRLSSDQAGRNPTRPPRRTDWTVDFHEDLTEGLG